MFAFNEPEMTPQVESRDQVFPEPTVGALIRNTEGKVLLVSSHKWFDKLTIPGGHIELGETSEEAVRREVKEEVGLDVKVLRLIITQEAIYSTEFWKKRHYLFFDYLCETDTDKVTVDNREIQSYTWVWPGEGLNRDLESFSRRVLEEYLGPPPR